MSRKSEWDELAAIVLGILGGIALVEILKKILQKKCSYCKNLNEFNREYCKFCGGKLK